MSMKITGSHSTSSHGRLFAVAALGISLHGCGSDSPDINGYLDSTEQGALGTNALGTNALGTNALGTNALGTNALGTNGINWLNETSTLKSDRFKLLKYLVKCALLSNQSIVVKAADAGMSSDQTLTGMYGLAGGWISGSMTETEQRWVTGCVLAHVNTLERQQRIALHGWASGFASVPAERATMYASEGRYWGNIFRRELWKNVCYTGPGGRNVGGYASPKNFDILLGRNCADTGCGVMTPNGQCPIGDNISSTTSNNWWNTGGTLNTNGYNSYGWVNQPNSIYGNFPTIEVAGPAVQEAEGSSGDYSVGLTCLANYAYSDGILSGAFTYKVIGSGTPTVSDCLSTARCSGSDIENHPNGQKLRGIPTGTRLRYAFMTGQPVGSTWFALRMRYSAASTNVKATMQINGGTWMLQPFDNTNNSWDSYNTHTWLVQYTPSPSDLKSVACGNGYNPNNMPYAVYVDIEAASGYTFPDIDAVWLEPY